MATHSSTRAWKIPWTEQPERLYSPRHRKESDTTEQLHSSDVKHGLYPTQMKMLIGNDTMHFNVHSSTIHNSQDVETTWMSIKRGMDKQDVVHIYDGILVSPEKEWNNAICSGMDGPRDYVTKWRKPDRKQTSGCHLYMKSKKQHPLVTLTKQKQTQRYRGQTRRWPVRRRKRERGPWPIKCKLIKGFPGDSGGKESACSAGDVGSIPGSGKIRHAWVTEHTYYIYRHYKRLALFPALSHTSL